MVTTRFALAATRAFSSAAKSQKLMFLGPPGVGKGTYASRICESLNIPHIAAGDLIRDQIKTGTAIGKEMKSYSEKGLLVPDEVIINLMRERLQKPDASNAFLLDGFPRTIGQAKVLDTIAPLDLVVNLSQREDIIIRKLASRRVCKGCGANYNYAEIREGELFMPALKPKVDGVCDKCGSHEIIQRADDKEEVIRDRLQIYAKETLPLVEYFKAKGILMDFDVVGGVEVLFPRFLKALQERLGARK